MIRKIYLDVCALSRPFDDQSQARIHLETNAVQIILSHIRSTALTMIISPAHRVESAAIPDQEERSYLELLFQQFGAELEYDAVSVRQRANTLTNAGMGIADAAHVAFAEAATADFISVDDRLLKQCKRLNVLVWNGTPLAFCDKEELR